jgi:Cytochrome bd terminal oxidase subunit I
MATQMLAYVNTNSAFSDPALWSRIQFAFTITYHYMFPQFTMGLAWFLSEGSCRCGARLNPWLGVLRRRVWPSDRNADTRNLGATRGIAMEVWL